MIILEGFRAYTKTTRFFIHLWKVPKHIWAKYFTIYIPDLFVLFRPEVAFVMSAPEFSDRSLSAGLAGLLRSEKK
jgi:hypothetical protein